MLLPLEIHHINVKQKDVTLIVLRDLNTLRTLLPEVTTGISDDEQEDLLPYAIAHHVNLEDTVIGAVLIDEGNTEYEADVMRYLETYGVVLERTKDGVCVIDTYCDDINENKVEHVFEKEKSIDAVFQKYQKDTYKFTSLKEMKHKTLKVGDTISIASYENQKLEITCVMDGRLVLKDKETKLLGSLEKKQVITEQKENSQCFMVEFGEFRYFIGGEITGDEDLLGVYESRLEKFITSAHSDIESDLSKAFMSIYKRRVCFNTPEGHVCGFRLNRHGSSASNTTKFLRTMEPVIGVITGATDYKFHAYPSQEVLDRVNKEKTPDWDGIPNSLNQVYITEMAADFPGYRRNIRDAKIVGDIIIRPEYLNYKEDQVEKKNRPIHIQVYGTGEQTEEIYQNKKTRPVTETSKKEHYPCGPWYHECNRHKML